MVEGHEQNQGISSQALAIIVIIILAAILSSVLSSIYPGYFYSQGEYVSGGLIYDVIYVILTVAADALYVIGGGVIAFGAILIIVHFIQTKLKNPYQPSFSTRYLSGYLTLSLNFFIGAEIIRTVAIRSIPEFELLILVIFSRGLFSLIIYLERRWHGTSESD